MTSVRRNALRLLRPTGLEKFATFEMVGVHLPTTDCRRHMVLSRFTQPYKDHQLLLQQLKLSLPPQPSPRISA